MTIRPSARDLYHTGSGQPVPVPTDEQIAAEIRRVLAQVFGTDVLDKPLIHAALINAARAVRQLFPTTTTPKDTQ